MPCTKIKDEAMSQQESNSIPLLELDTLDMLCRK